MYHSYFCHFIEKRSLPGQKMHYFILSSKRNSIKVLKHDFFENSRVGDKIKNFLPPSFCALKFHYNLHSWRCVQNN